MSKYVISCLDVDEGEAIRAAVRDAHLSYLQSLGDTVLIAGPYLDAMARPIGSLYIIAAASEADARSFIDDDPYTKAGVFRHIDIRSWRIGISNI